MKVEPHTFAAFPVAVGAVILRLGLVFNAVLLLVARRPALAVMDGVVYVGANLALAHAHIRASMVAPARTPRGGKPPHLTPSRLMGYAIAQAGVSTLTHIFCSIPLVYTGAGALDIAGLSVDGLRRVSWFVPSLVMSVAALSTIVDVCATRTKEPCWERAKTYFGHRVFGMVLIPLGFVATVVVKIVRFLDADLSNTDLALSVVALVVEVVLVAGMWVLSRLPVAEEGNVEAPPTAAVPALPASEQDAKPNPSTAATCASEPDATTSEPAAATSTPATPPPPGEAEDPVATSDVGVTAV